MSTLRRDGPGEGRRMTDRFQAAAGADAAGRRPTRWRPTVVGTAALLVALIVFVVPFAFIALQAVKTRRDASRLDFAWPSEWQLWQNLWDVVRERNFMLLLAYWNSTLITVAAVTLLVIFASMVGYVLSRLSSDIRNWPGGDTKNWPTVKLM